MSEQMVCVSYFDQVIGPSLFYCNADFPEDSIDAPDLGRILEFNGDREGTFIFAFRKYQTINQIFYMDSNLARGGKEIIMLSYLVKAAYFKNEITDVFKYLESKGPILEEFSKELKKLREFPSVLHSKIPLKGRTEVLEIGSNEFKAKFIDMFNKYAKQLSPALELFELSASKRKTKKIFIFGAPNAGKSTFLKSIETVQFHQQQNTDLPTKIYELIIENLELLTYDCIEKQFECERCKNLDGCLQNAQAFILILDISHKNALNDARNKIQSIINKCEDLNNETTPILVIGNKIDDKEEIFADVISERLNFKELADCGIKIKYFPINIARDTKSALIALKWLVKEIL